MKTIVQAIRLANRKTKGASQDAMTRLIESMQKTKHYKGANFSNQDHLDYSEDEFRFSFNVSKMLSNTFAIETSVSVLGDDFYCVCQAIQFKDGLGQGSKYWECFMDISSELSTVKLELDLDTSIKVFCEKLKAMEISAHRQLLQTLGLSEALIKKAVK